MVRGDIRHSTLTRYGAAVALVAIAILLRLAMDSLWGTKLPYFTFYPAVVAAAWLGGVGPGILATAAAAAVSVGMMYSSPAARNMDLLSVPLFVLMGIAISLLEGRLHRGRQQVADLLESISDGFIALDRRWRYTFVNARAAELCRRRPEDLLGRTVWEAFPDFVGTSFEAVAREAVAQQMPRHLQFYYAPYGVWSEIRMYPSSQGLALYLQDITERRHSEETAFRLAAIVESSDDAIVGEDLNGLITSWNRAAERMFGFTALEAIGQPITIITPPDRRPETDAVLQRIRRGETVDHYETIRMRKDGGPVQVSLTVSPIRGADGEIIGASKISRDIGERKRGEAERARLLASERAARAEAEAANRAKDEFLAVLSHELRTPLAAVYGWARMLQRGLDEAAAARALDVILRNADAQVKLIDDLLDVSRIASGKMRLDVRSVDILAVVEAAIDAVRPASDAKAIVLRTVLDPRTGPISGDPDRLQQVVWNLLTNAVKFTPKGGRVEVQLRRVNSHVEVAVSDTGQGIAASVLPFIFDRFRQADSSSTRVHGGLGLGLALVRHLVEAHGGTVSAHSEGEGQGASFVVRLPVTIAQAPAEKGRAHPTADGSPLASASARLDGLRVLVVDDDPDAVQLAAVILGSAGASVRTCHSAASALDLLGQWRPHVLVSDIEMPGEDGYSLIRRVRAREPEQGGRTPAVALTAYGRTADRIRSLSAGFSMHLSKPVDPAELVMVVATVAATRGEEEARAITG